MEGFNIIDGVILAIVLISAILAYARGIVREAMAIVGWIVAARGLCLCASNGSFGQRNPHYRSYFGG